MNDTLTARCTCDEPGGCVGTCDWSRSGQYREVPPPHRRVPLIDCPLPLDDGSTAWLRYPMDGLTRSEADRIRAMIDTFVVDEGSKRG